MKRITSSLLAAVVVLAGVFWAASLPQATAVQADYGAPVQASLVTAEPADLEPTALEPSAPEPAAHRPQQIDSGWLKSTAKATGIPQRALQSYAQAAAIANTNNPGCGLGWNTLAAVGFIESGHGTHGGFSVRPDGNVSGRILGPRLDGQEFAAIADTDAGELDGDPLWDRAVGPFQFIPATWATFGVDGNGDGKADPHNMDDSALSAAGYLCASGRNLRSAAGWTAAVFAYNQSDSYVRSIHKAANSYASSAP